MKIIVLTGAGISAESGLKTFRDANGLWEGHDVMEVASPEGFVRNPQLVLDFYNQRRKQLLEVTPNEAHKQIALLETKHEVSVITQNVDDLHERGGSTNVIHLHGELLKIRSTKYENDIRYCDQDINLGDLCERGAQLRPHIVWFGEAVPMFEKAITEISNADAVIIVGTSMQVYPAASLVHYAPTNATIYFVDPHPNINESELPNLTIFAEKASSGVKKVVDSLL
ncbi:SIR2 family NAD-dependent protein deacylase [Neptunitalea lumnitzerae]|uniref:NAD-dependent protein deacylase n=1 Tax=Neptunitalea lumnitzerae TaxID=2965509 RepID=A0ABQ5MM12_9FLAO|nr:NAD-dependent deacylase [Neptunitalea sp. Y10]GLB49992.1 NAD-dependent protein deacylase [Neptunitalea sp. Y10]